MTKSRYQDTPLTTADLQWAELLTLDLSLFDQPGGRDKLASQLQHAVHNVGFFYVSNFGLTQADVDQQYELCQAIFAEPLEIKMRCKVDLSLTGGPLGYKPAGLYPIGTTGLKDQIEIYDDPKYNAHFAQRVRPRSCIENAISTERFCRHLHNHVLYRLLVLTAIVLELEDEEMLWKMHNYDDMSNCHMRYMRMPARSSEELAILEETKSNYIAGHTDLGSFTFLFRQPVACLQIMKVAPEHGSEEVWEWVKPAEHAITVNVGDTISFLTGGYLKSTMHRVVVPPEDQIHLERSSVIYFTRPDDDTILEAVDSPVISRFGNTTKSPPGRPITAGESFSKDYGKIANFYSSKR